MGSESLLVNFVYCHAVGHAVEALQHCLGYHRADPERRIGVVLKANTAVDLASWCPFIDEVHTVDVDVFGRPETDALAGLPRDWDWVVDEPRGWEPVQRSAFPGLARYYDLAGEHFRARRGHTVIGGPDGPSYRSGGRLDLRLPDDATARARLRWPDVTGTVTIGLLPGGSAERSLYPSVASWRRIVSALGERLGRVRFCLLGKLAADGRTTTSFTRREYETLGAAAASISGTEVAWAVDVPLAEQLAAVRRCDFLLSPHSGFGFTALAVGTPWLTLAGNKWPEYYFNSGVPFYSVLPDVDRFPCYTMFGPDPEPVDDDGPRSPSMSAARIDADLPELVEAAARLAAGEWDFDRCMTDHFARMTRLHGGRTEYLYSLDNLHLDYLSAG